MTRSKLEAYYEREFGPRPAEAEAEAPGPRPAAIRRKAAAAPLRRRGPGLLGLLKLVVLVGPMAVLLATGLFAECRAVPRDSWLPDVLRSTACARRDLAGRVLALEDTLRTVANGLR